MQTEILKMSDEEVLNFILLLNTSMTEYKMLKYYQNSDLIHTQLKEAKELFLKRLSKNNIEEFKKKYFKNSEICERNYNQVIIDFKTIEEAEIFEDLINNIGKE